MPLIDAAPDALARTYAQSLFELAHQQGSVQQGSVQRTEETLGELEDILELTRAEPKFGEFLSSLIVPARKREASLKAIFGGRVSELTLNFLLVLNKKERLSHLPTIVSAFERMVQESFGRVEVDVYTPTPIDQHQLADIRTRLQTVLKREPVMHAYVDESMIGGLRMQIGDQLIDASVSTRLRKMREKLTQNAAALIRSRADGLFEN